MAPAAARPWADPRFLVGIGLQTLLLLLAGVAWKAGVDKDVGALQDSIKSLVASQATLSLTVSDHAGRIVRVETQVVALEPALARLQTTLDRAMRFMPLEQRGSAGALPRLP